VDLRLDDDASGTVAADEDAYLAAVVADATEELNSYLLGRYDAARLAQSYLVAKWARYLAAKELCERRGNPVPKSILAAVGDPDKRTGILGRLARVAEGRDSLESVPQRLAPSPAWANVRVVPGRELRKAVVERPLSEQTAPPQLPAYDEAADYTPYPL
jgi:hypothetical protein